MSSLTPEIGEPGPAVPSTPRTPDLEQVPKMASWARAQHADRMHLSKTYREWKQVQDLIKAGRVDIDGFRLDVATVVAVAKHGCRPFIILDPALISRMRKSKEFLESQLRWGRNIYGVNTGFGANADSRTTDYATLQRALTQHQQSAILIRNDFSVKGDKDGEHKSQSMPTSWVRGAMLVRVNTIVRGHSAISLRVVETLTQMIRKDMIPIVPLRGSISASGDLMPLAYIAGALQGNPDIFVRTAGSGGRRILKASDAMAEIQRTQMVVGKGRDPKLSKDDQAGKKPEVGQDQIENEEGKKKAKNKKKKKNRKGNEAGDDSKDTEGDQTGDQDSNDIGESETREDRVADDDSKKSSKAAVGKDGDEHNQDNYTPLVLGPKEGLALVNGTAPSATVAALAIYEANHLAVLAQVVTCLSSEAMAANIEWAHPFLAEIRLSAGQLEVSRNLRYFFRGSQLVTGLSKKMHGAGARSGLAQDRYSLRTSTQWLGPAVEDLWISGTQLQTELNSTTDNPVVNIETGDIYCGGNFQAMSVTMITEKSRLCLQHIGKMLFAQTSEMINPVTSKGLPPNLAADDPSLSFCMKGVDINMAAYQSELAMLANPVSSHVQSAEMHNQAVNSLALISARYTMDSVEVLAMMTAAAIYVGLQAVDLRVLHHRFMQTYPKDIEKSMRQLWEGKVSAENVQLIMRLILPQISVSWYANASCDLHDRCHKVAKAVSETLLDHLFSRDRDEDRLSLMTLYDGLHALKKLILNTMASAFEDWRNTFFAQTVSITTPLLGHGTRTLYQFVRGELGVPFHRGLADDPLSEPSASDSDRPKKTVGSWISIIYEAVRDGRVCGHILESMREDLESDPGMLAGLAKINETVGSAMSEAMNHDHEDESRALQEQAAQSAPGRRHRRRG